MFLTRKWNLDVEKYIKHETVEFLENCIPVTFTLPTFPIPAHFSSTCSIIYISFYGFVDFISIYNFHFCLLQDSPQLETFIILYYKKGSIFQLQFLFKKI